ncbi:hypothetical protein HPB49_012019 [Dermacentor silvarum]|uniref:Uncharacterized protein n=1 Tax=Dermacentor silvarum TaxID=543639 RepID=A0ACB8DP34_DERSI|nr:hypothetical protein HPB49_012019 [Dermacentor silvarum]
MNPGGTAEAPATRPCSAQPRVRFKRLPFYDVLAQLLPPARLATSGSADCQTTRLQFQFGQQHLKDIRSSLTQNVGSTPELQVHLRFRLLDTSLEQEDSYPSDLAVMHPFPPSLPDGAPTEWICLLINITSFCVLSPSVKNLVSVTWRPVRQREYVAVVFLVRKLSVATVLSGLPRRVILTRTMMNVQRQANCDGIACDWLASFAHLPPGQNANEHMQCFDASNYLLVNERRPTWMCPVCGQRAACSSLVIDKLFAHIVAEAPGDCDSVVFREDGSWTPSAASQNVHNLDKCAAAPSSSTARSSTPPGFAAV